MDRFDAPLPVLVADALCPLPPMAPDWAADDARRPPADGADPPEDLRAEPFPPAGDLRTAPEDFAGVLVAADLAGALPGALAGDLPAAAREAPLAALDLAGVVRLPVFATGPPALRPPALATADFATALPLVFVGDLAPADLVVTVLRAADLPAELPAPVVPAVRLPATALRAAGALRPPLAVDLELAVFVADFPAAVFFAAGLFAPVFLLADLRGLVVAMRLSRRLIAPRCSGTSLDITSGMQDR
ncbi:MAG: hypothetical protein ACJ8GK_04785 [Luteimonas sp.]